ncbi:hypothetical protein AAHB34_18190 [Paenarthrobacter ureafaciens]
MVEADLQDFGVKAGQQLTALRAEVGAKAGELSEAKAAEKAAVQELKDFRDALKGVLLPLSAKLEEIPLAGTYADASHKMGQFQGLALELLFLTAGKGRFPNAARVTLYGVENGLPKLIDFRGRGESPRETFHGDSLSKIQELMRRGDARVFYTDDDANSVTPSRGSTYQVVVASSVGRKPPKHGMLTIDSSARDHLSDDDLAVVQSVGSMLAASHRIVGIIQDLERVKSENTALTAELASLRAAGGEHSQTLKNTLTGQYGKAASIRENVRGTGYSSTTTKLGGRMNSSEVINRAMDQLLSGKISPEEYVDVVSKANEELATHELDHRLVAA